MNQKIHSQTLAHLLALVAVLLALANGSWAASITWGVATTIAGDTDVPTSGTLKYAYAEANTGTPTVNGVPFIAVNRQTTALGTNATMTGFTGSASAAYTTTSTPFSGLSTAYKNILIGAIYGGASATVTLKNLTVGRTYLVQFWVSDPRSNGGTQTDTLSSTGGNSVTLRFNTAGAVAGGLGQYAIGTFTADGTSQAMTIASVGSQMNAIQVRDVTSVWGSTSSGNWSTTGNWTGGTVASGAGVVADFSTLNITADTTVHLDSAFTVSTLLFGDTDTSSAAGWILDDNGNSANILTLDGNTYYPAPAIISVGALGTGKGATISAVLAGTAALTKAGAGQLTLSGVNTYTGGTSISAGTLLVNGSLASGSAVTVGSGATLGGVGTLNGTVTVNAGAWLDAGTNGVGTQTCSGNLTLNATSTNIFTVTTSGNSQVSVAGTLTPNSSVIYIKTGGNQLGAGTNTLFTYGTVSGSFNTNLVFETTQTGPAANATIVDDSVNKTIKLGVAATGELYPSTISYGGTSFSYNGLGQSPTISFVGSTGARTTNYVGTGSTSYASVNAPTNVGTYYVSNTLAADANFAEAANSQAFTISQSVSSWNYSGTSFNYNGTGQTPTISFSGSTGIKTTNYMGTGSTSYASVNVPTNVGTYAVTNTVLADVNYPGATNGVTFTIGPTNLTVMAQFNTKAYDGTTSAATPPTVTAGSLQAGDTATLTEAYSDATLGTNKTLIPSVAITNAAAGVNVLANYNLTLVSNFTGAITWPLGGNGTPYYLDMNGTTAGFGTTVGVPYIGISNGQNWWTTSTAGTTAPAAFPIATAGGQLTVGYNPSDFNGESFTITIDASDKINGIVINATNATVTLASLTGNSGNSYFNVNGIGVTNALGSTLIWNVLYSGSGAGSYGGFNMGNHAVMFSGGGTNTFITHMGFNSASGGGLINNGSVINLNYAYTETTYGSFQSGFTINSGALNFGTANAADAFIHFTTNSFMINGGTIDNLSGAPLTLIPSPYVPTKIGGNFTFAGSSSLNLGNSNVRLTASPTVTVSANTLTVGGVISDEDSGYSLTKAGNGTLALAGANTYSGPTTISGGTLALIGSGTIANTGIISVGNGAMLDVSGLGWVNSFALQYGQTLSNSAAANGILNGNFFAVNGIISISYTNGTPSFTVTNGTLTLSAATTFNLGNVGPALTVGSYLIIATNRGGTVTTDATGLPPVTMGNTVNTASLTITNGQLYLNVFPGDSTVTRLAVLGFPNPTGKGVAGSVTVKALNTNGVIMPFYTGTVTLTNSDPAGSAPISHTFTASDNGVFTFVNGVTLNTVTADTNWAIIATDANNPSITGSQTNLQVTTGSGSVFFWAQAGSGNWSVPANWNNDLGLSLAPATTGQTNYTLNFNLSGAYNAANNLNNGFLLNQLNFGGDTVILSGNSLAFTDNGATPPAINQNGSGNGVVSNSMTLNRNLTVGGSGSGTVTLAGAVTGTGGLTKIGSGVLALTGSNVMSGPIQVSGGTLAAFGEINSPVTVGSGGTLQPWLTAINGGVLDLNNHPLTLGAGSTTFMQLGKTLINLVRGVSTLTYGGTLTIANASGASFSAGSSFKLFDAASYSGTFGSVNLPALGSGLSWYLNDLTNCGTIRVVPAWSVAAVFDDNMVLQRGQPVPVWGSANPGQTVTVSFGGQTKSATAGPDRKWLVQLDAMVANANAQNFTVTISGVATVVYTNVLVGDVWLASGQSNMYMQLSGSGYGILTNAAAEIASANYPLIRFMLVNQNNPLAPAWDASVAQSWTVCSSNTVINSSAVAYFFGRGIIQNTNVPIGLLESSVGGTPAEAWASLAAMSAMPELQPLVEQEIMQYLQGLQPNRSKVAGCLFNGMISPLIPFAVRGAIWYQGENNAQVGQGHLYRVLLPALIQDWRSRWQQADFPFYIVQLTGYNGFSYVDLREAELLTLQTVTNTGLAVTIDIGDPGNIHPSDKQDVGARLAALALNRNYGLTNVVPSGPIYRTYAIEASRIRIYFDYTDGGLMTGQKNGIGPLQELVGVPPQWFEIAGDNQTYYPATAVIDTNNNTVVLSSPSVSSPKLARYAWSVCPMGTNLYNRAGLPASPFRIPAWMSALPSASLQINAGNLQSACFVPTNVTWWVEFADRLAGSVWTPLILPQTGTNSVQTFTDPITGSAQRFYRWGLMP